MKSDQKKLVQAYRSLYKTMHLLKEYGEANHKSIQERNKLVGIAWDVRRYMDNEAQAQLRSEGLMV